MKSLILATICLFMLGCGFRSEPSIEWDLSQNHDINSVNWPADNKDDFWWLGGVRKFELKFANTRIECEVTDVWVDRQHIKEEKIGRLKVNLRPMTKQEAYDRALELTGRWKINDSGIRKWFNAKDPLAGHDGGAGGDIDDVKVEIRVKKSMNESRPWYIFIAIYFDSGVWLKTFGM